MLSSTCILFLMSVNALPASVNKRSVDSFDYSTLTGSFISPVATTRDDACSRDQSKCKVTRGGGVDPGSVVTQCGTDGLALDVVGLDNSHFGTELNGVKTAVCGLPIYMYNPATGKSAVGVVGDRIFQNNGPLNGGTSQVDLTSSLNKQLGGNGQDNIMNIQVRIGK